MINQSMKYKIVLALYKVIEISICPVLNEMEQGWTGQSWNYHSPE